MDNQYHSAKEIAALNNREEIVQLLDDVMAKQSALNTKTVQKLKEKSLNEAEKRIKYFYKLQTKNMKLAEKEEKQREKHRKKSYCLLNTKSEIVNVNNNNKHQPNIYDKIDQLNLNNNNNVNNISNNNHHHSNNNSNVPKFSDLVNATVKGSNKMKILSGVSRKMLITKKHHNSSDTIKSIDANGTCRSVQSTIGIRRDDHIVYVPKFNSLSVNDLVARSNQCNGNKEWNNTNGVNNNRLPLKDVFNCEKAINCNKTNTFNKTIRTTLKSKLLRLNKLGNKNANNKITLYRAVSEPDFLQCNRDQLINKEVNSKNAGNFPRETSSIFERPGFGSVSFRGKFTPDLMFSPTRLYHSDSDDDDEDNNDNDDDDDDFDSGHDNSRENSQSSNNVDSNTSNTSTEGKYYSKNSTQLSADIDSFASDSIGSAGSLVHNDYFEDIHDEHYLNNRNDNESKTVSVLLFLYAHGLKDYYEIFESEQIDIEALMLLNENDLITLGIPLGPRKKLYNAIQNRKEIMKKEELVFETKL